MRTALRYFTLVFGAVCCLIALAHILIGPSAIPGSVPVNATMDSEDRFYATLFLGFGAAMIWCSQDLMARGRLFDVLMLVFFLGGVARIISAVSVGLPVPLFQFLGALELIIPPVACALRRKAFSAG
ncbi:MAG: DUF4345 domain-containing protein [Hyphomonas sp.]